jgi:hypothetical protein
MKNITEYLVFQVSSCYFGIHLKEDIQVGSLKHKNIHYNSFSKDGYLGSIIHNNQTFGLYCSHHLFNQKLPQQLPHQILYLNKYHKALTVNTFLGIKKISIDYVHYCIELKRIPSITSFYPLENKIIQLLDLDFIKF